MEAPLKHAADPRRDRAENRSAQAPDDSVEPHHLTNPVCDPAVDDAAGPLPATPGAGPVPGSPAPAEEAFVDYPGQFDDLYRAFRRARVAGNGPLPPPPPGVRYLSLRRWGTIVCDDGLRSTVDRFFYVPMILLAFAVLPLLVIEVMQLAQGWVQAAVNISFGMIWVAFVAEFVLKIAIAESRIEYVRRNWLDLCVILVPLARPLRLGSSMARTTRMFKLRGVGMKMARHGFAAALGLGATEVVLRRLGLSLQAVEKSPESMTRYELIDEIKRLRKVHDSWSAWYTRHNAHIAEHGCCFGPDFPLVPPVPLAPSVALAAAAAGTAGAAGVADDAVAMAAAQAEGGVEIELEAAIEGAASPVDGEAAVASVDRAHGAKLLSRERT